MKDISQSPKTVESKSDKERLLDVHSDFVPPMEIMWGHVAVFAFWHAAALVALVLIAQGHFQWKTLLWAAFLYVAAMFGTTAGAHRLWSHRSYKATLPLRIILAILQTLAFQKSIFKWVRDHRLHHKYVDTHADPHNSNRGFFFSHLGWAVIKKHPLVTQKLLTIDMSDLENDPIVSFQRRHYFKLLGLVCFFIPSAVPCLFWGESFLTSWLVATQLRFCATLHSTSLVNSAAHSFGSKPYDKHIKPVENTAVSILALGEGYHNYHHTFPYDYRASELGFYKFNFTTTILHLFAWAGLAYNMKTINQELIIQRASRTGDGSHSSHLSKTSSTDSSSETQSIVGGPWGWGDSDIPQEDIEATETLFLRNKQL